ncbi:MAG: phosphoglycerate mutase family protein [Bacteroidota bacterium]
MKAITLLFPLALALLFVGCKEDKASDEEDSSLEDITTFYFIRHAEKDRLDPENIDPELDQKGLGRAMHWAEILNDVDLDAIYSTDYERTSMTAAPAAVKQDIIVQYYTLEEMNIEQFKSDNLNNNVLVVGHSDTTPQFVNQIIGEDKYSTMDEYDNGSLYIVQIVNGTTSDMRLQFNCNCPD